MCDILFTEALYIYINIYINVNNIRFCESNGCNDYAVMSYTFILHKCKKNDYYIIRGLLYIPRLTYKKEIYDDTFHRIQRNAIYLKNEHKFIKYVKEYIFIF